MARVTPFLLFDGDCAKAMQFYATCFGGELLLTQLGETPMRVQFPEAMHGKVTYAHLKAGLVEISGTDWLHPVRRPVVGNTVAVLVASEDAEELRAVFGRLAEGAREEFFVGLMEMPFGLYGRFTDRFGVEWFFRGGVG
ncbi:MAG TPA: VOC family protein [Acidobacteriaceae bacterium]|nr:VOC family protein [Acidobacteriaceae bacterium]